jgi:hypothetical protein
MEAILKIYALGFKGYYYNPWNRFDLFVVIISIFDILLTIFSADALGAFKVGPQIGRIFRVLRISRLLKLIKSFKGLQNLIQTTIYSLPSLLNVAALLFLVFFIFSIMAVFLFQDLRLKNFLVLNILIQTFFYFLIF